MPIEITAQHFLENFDTVMNNVIDYGMSFIITQDGKPSVILMPYVDDATVTAYINRED